MATSYCSNRKGVYAYRMSGGRTGPDALEWRDGPVALMGPHDVRVDIHAVGLNRADLLQCLGLYPAPPGAPADIPGLEIAGQVLDVGAQVTHWVRGDRVMGLTSGGAFAETVVVDSRTLVGVPSNLSLTEAAAIPEAFQTAFDALVLQAQVQRGAWVLITAAGSGVGTAAVQLGRALEFKTLGTSRTAQKLVRCQTLGLTQGFLADGGDSLSTQVMEATQGAGAQVALELVGGPGFSQTLASMAPGGTVMLVGLTGGSEPKVALGTLLSKRLHIVGTTLRARPVVEKAALARAFDAALIPYFEQGVLAPVIDRVLPRSALIDGLKMLQAGSTFGKLVVEMHA